jgi:AcrR family transcriptional regulator
MSADTSIHTDTHEDVAPARRPLRADAQRNYDKIVEAARVLFREKGADTSLDEIAKSAGVGPGTLYRHFPTRDALIDAVMKDWSDRVHADAGEVLAAGLGTRETLTTWLDRLVEHMSRYQGAPAKFASALDDTGTPMHHKCTALVAANKIVFDDLDAQGALRTGVDPRDVVRMVTGIAAAAEKSGLGHESATPMLAIVADGVLRA